MTPHENNIKKDNLTFIGFLFAGYYSVLACNNEPLPLYLGYVIIAGLIVLDKLFSRERLKVVFPTSCKCLYYFTVFCYFSRIWAWNPYLVTARSKFLIPAMIFLVIAINYFIKIRSSKPCVYAILFSGIVLSIYTIFQNGGLSEFYRLATLQGTRIGRSGMNVNNSGIICAFSVVLLAYYAMYKKKRFCYAVAVLPFVVSIASGSRKSIILMVVGILTLIFLAQKDKKGVIKYIKFIVMISLFFVLMKAILSLEIMSTVNQRMNMLFATLTGDSFNADGSSLTRAKMIRVGFQQFKETPILGIGLGNSPELNGRRINFYTYTHNDYIEHLVNGGIIGFLLYYGTVIYLAIKHIKLMKNNKKSELIFSFATIIMFLVMNAASVNYYGSMMTYLYFTLWIAEVEISEREQWEISLQKDSQ